MLCDFGSASPYQRDSMTLHVAKPWYKAPELHEDLRLPSYGPPTDVCSLGMVALALLGGEHPWGNPDKAKKPWRSLFQGITAFVGPLEDGTEAGCGKVYKTSHVKFTRERCDGARADAEAFWKNIADRAGADAPDAATAQRWVGEARDFVGAALRWAPSRRPSAAELLRHPFFACLGEIPMVVGKRDPVVEPPNPSESPLADGHRRFRELAGGDAEWCFWDDGWGPAPAPPPGTSMAEMAATTPCSPCPDGMSASPCGGPS